MNYLLIDGPYIAHRAHYSTGMMSFNGQPTGVAFGFLRDLENFTDLFMPDRVVIAWDSPVSLRERMLPTYKSTRKQKRQDSEQAQLEHKMYIRQVQHLKESILPDCGYRNSIEVEGYEADDIIAHIAGRIKKEDQAVMVSSDNDLFQCLRPNVRFFSPASMVIVTYETFSEKWGLPPECWCDVKALAGCSTDDVPGIEGIGEVTAAKWFRGVLKETTQAYGKIKNNLGIIAKNSPLVRLPMAGIAVGEILHDSVTEEKKDIVKARLGIGGRLSERSKKKSQAMGFDV